MTEDSSFPPNRLVSLDVFRGLTMMAMVLVNNPGTWDSVYPPLLHAEWHGFTFTDTIFPFFLFIVGTAMPFSFARRLRDGDRNSLIKQIIRRTIILFLLGFLFNVIYWLAGGNLRVPGVLQRIALCYFAMGWMALYFNEMGLWITGAALLIVYTIGMKLIPVPGYGSGVLDPTGNFCWWIDHLILRGHTWSGAPVAGFDPEGVWSTLPAIVTAMLGFSAGSLLRSEREGKDKLISLFVRGNLCLLAGYITMALMPVNKQLWTVPYVFVTAGLSYNILGLFYYWIDFKGIRKGITPAVIYGSNAIFIYVGSGIGAILLGFIRIGNGDSAVSLKTWLFESCFLSWASSINASLAMGLAYVLVWLGIASFLYRRRIFIKV